MILDPTSPIGKLRLRVGDFSDLPLYPDEVYLSALEDSGNNLAKATKLMAQYILAMLSQQTRQRIVQLEVFGNEWFKQYLTFIKETITNPEFMDTCPVPYTASVVDEYGNETELPLAQFSKDWNANYVGTTQSQDMHLAATLNPFTGV